MNFADPRRAAAIVLAPLMLFAAPALADAPDRVAAEISGGAGLDHLTVSPDGRLVGAANGSSVYVLDTDDWSVASSAPCTAESVAFASTETDAVDVWVGCLDGFVQRSSWESGVLAASTSEFDVGLGLIAGMYYDETGDMVYALEDDAGQLYLHSIDPVTEVLDGVAGYPVALTYDGFVDATVSLGSLYIAHGSDEITKIVLGGSTTVLSTIQLSVSIEDIAAGPSGGIYGIDGSGYLVEYTTAGQWLTLFNDLASPTAVAFSDAEDDSWVWVAEEGQSEVFAVSGTAVDTEAVAAFTMTPMILDGVVGPDAYAFGATDEGNFAVVTSNPWIDELVATPATAVTGDTVYLGFVADGAGDYEVFLGGDRSGSGSQVSSGTVGDDGLGLAELTVGDSWAEGDNDLYVLLTDSLGRTGHAKTAVFVDNPPDTIPLSDNDLGFGDRALILEFDGIDDEDLDRYVVYVTTTPFTSGDYPTGGPDFDGNDALRTPIEVSAEPSESVSVYIYPLTNDVTYYVAVRAIDAGGLEGPMSRVLSQTPRPTFSASELSGESGGWACSSTGASGLVGWLVVGASALLLRRRRVAAGAAALLLVAGLPAEANAKDLTPAWSNFEVRYGGLTYTDDNITRVYGSSGTKTLQIEVGPQLFRLFEIDLGAAFNQSLGWTVDEGGLQSAEASNLTVVPLSAGLTGRLHLWDEQPVVPFLGYGLDYFLWRESWDSGVSTKETVNGAKQGWHRAAGLNLLLDVFSPGRASWLEAQTGINDTWITFEWRSQFNDESKGLSLAADSFTVGLKLDY